LGLRRKWRSNVLQVPPLRGGDFQGIRGLSSDALYRARWI